MHVIAIANRKGGVGKSTTSDALISGLKLRGYKVLGIDLDAQCNLSSAFGVKKAGKGTFELLTRQEQAKDVIIHTPRGDIIAGSPALAGADQIISQTGKEYRLKEALEDLKSYDYIILDCPPALGILTVNALAFCTDVIAPVQADMFSLEGLEQLFESCEVVKRYCNPNLEVTGILLTRFSPRSVLSRDMTALARNMAKKSGTRLLKTTIREAVAIREAQINQMSIFEYAPKSKVAKDYSEFIDELLSLEGKSKKGNKKK